MLRSAGYFEKIPCPYFLRGCCERPFCHYRHQQAETLFAAPSGSRAAENGKDPLTRFKAYSSTLSKPAALSEKDPSVMELERINKAIETVKCEVEKEQKRLTHYKNLQGKVSSSGSCPDSVAPLTIEDHSRNKIQNASATRKFPSSYSGNSKYVVDKSKPRTDLEYDPLSNYSADLRNPKSQQCEGHEKRGIKRTKEEVSVGTTERLNKEIEMQESDDDGILVIDIPPLENDGKRTRSSKRCKSNVNQTEKLTEAAEDGDVLAKTLIQNVLDPVLQYEPNVSLITKAERPKGLEYKNSFSATDGKFGNEVKSSSLAFTSTRTSTRLEKSNSETKATGALRKQAEHHIPSSSSVSDCSKANLKSTRELEGSSCAATKSQRKPEWDLMIKGVDPSKSEQRDGYKEGIHCLPIQPKPPSLTPNPVLQLKGSDRGGISPSLKTKTEDQSKVQQTSDSNNKTYCPPLQQKSTVPSIQKGQSEAEEFNFDGINFLLPTENLKFDQEDLTKDSTGLQLQQELLQSCIPQLATTELEYSSCSLNPSPVLPENDENAAIDLASEAETGYSDLDTDLSDSDTMEECYRIFMEANEPKPETQEKSNAAVDIMDVDKPELEKKPNLLPGQKKRVAHISKYNEVNKNRQQVVIPFRGPTVQLPNLSRIHQLQQQASVLTAAVKGGQAFVAATTGQKKPIIVATSTPLPSPVQTVAMTVPWTIIVPEGSIASLPITHIPTPVAPQRVTYTPSKAISTRRKPKVPAESSSKVPHDVRQRYVNQFVEEFLKTSFTVEEAFEKALAEEKAVFDRSTNKLKYLSIAVNSLKRLKNQTNPSVKCMESHGQGSRGNTIITPGTVLTNDAASVALYEQLKEYVLSEEMLKANNYPLQHPDKPSAAVLYGEISKRSSTDSSKRICCRCGATYSVSLSGKHVRKEECNYHCGKVLKKKVPGGMDTRYSCCEGAVGTPGCQVFKLHVHDGVKDNLEGFVKTFQKPIPVNGSPGVFALDCEMCYTTQGLELARVTVVNSSLQVIYDTFVKPDNEVIDYNTRFSGVTEEDLQTTTTSIRDVQAVLLNLFSADTILIGHGFENDLCALKLLHGTVVDTAMVFPHRLGLPHKRALRSLTADYLRRIIQESVDGHDSSEDASACMELMLWKIKEDGKVKRW
ncbi:RNA exonuclease 1 homolog isoform X2 [Amia ocellicauda]|uniref:RNA exonuclease 1 homolog isoform X2 n=1 Tax=Amia ocellicauda TaxID=2972642 RepID=UPI003463FE51